MVQENYGAVRFSVGGVIGAGVSIVLRNVLKLLAISFLMSIPITVLAGLFVATLPIGFSALQSGVRTDFSELSDATKVLFALLFVGIFLTYFAIQAAVNYAAFQNLRGERVGIGACMRRGLAAMPRVVVACIMLALMMIGIGIAVSIVMILITAVISLSGPSTGGGIAIGLLYGVGFFGIFIFMFIIWWVFIPAIVVEDAGPVACFAQPPPHQGSSLGHPRDSSPGLPGQYRRRPGGLGLRATRPAGRRQRAEPDRVAVLRGAFIGAGGGRLLLPARREGRLRHRRSRRRLRLM
jgi:hypothetical protein